MAKRLCELTTSHCKSKFHLRRTSRNGASHAFRLIVRRGMDIFCNSPSFFRIRKDETSAIIRRQIGLPLQRSSVSAPKFPTGCTFAFYSPILTLCSISPPAASATIPSAARAARKTLLLRFKPCPIHGSLLDAHCAETGVVTCRLKSSVGICLTSSRSGLQCRGQANGRDEKSHRLRRGTEA